MVGTRHNQPTPHAPKTPRYLSPLTPPHPRRGRRGRHAIAAKPLPLKANRPFLPPREFGGRNEPEQTAAARSEHSTRRRIGKRCASMDAGAPLARRRLLHQGAGGGRRPSRSDRSEAEPVRARRRVPRDAQREEGAKLTHRQPPAMRIGDGLAVDKPGQAGGKDRKNLYRLETLEMPQERFSTWRVGGSDQGQNDALRGLCGAGRPMTGRRATCQRRSFARYTL